MNIISLVIKTNNHNAKNYIFQVGRVGFTKYVKNAWSRIKK